MLWRCEECGYMNKAEEWVTIGCPRCGSERRDIRLASEEEEE
jgi:Zn finger protein HypA/HybF involved in hydrogenase expression